MGRGELQLAILIETMRREGYELTVGKPEILTKSIVGRLHEPVELLIIDCPDTFLGVVIEKLGSRKGKMLKLLNRGSARVRLVCPGLTRGLLRPRSQLCTVAAGHRSITETLL